MGTVVHSYHTVLKQFVNSVLKLQSVTISLRVTFVVFDWDANLFEIVIFLNFHLILL